jgi:hypothetical protein
LPEYRLLILHKMYTKTDGAHQLNSVFIVHPDFDGHHSVLKYSGPETVFMLLFYCIAVASVSRMHVRIKNIFLYCIY